MCLALTWWNDPLIPRLRSDQNPSIPFGFGVRPLFLIFLDEMRAPASPRLGLRPSFVGSAPSNSGAEEKKLSIASPESYTHPSRETFEEL